MFVYQNIPTPIPCILYVNLPKLLIITDDNVNLCTKLRFVFVYLTIPKRRG